jgi:hypothetical protein
MGYTVNIEGFEGQNIEVNIGFWGEPELLVDGVAAQKGSKRGEMILQRNDGRQVIATWKSRFLGLDVPRLNVDGKTIGFVEPLKWYQWVWGGWPLILIFIGGALGGFIGAVGCLINVRIFRTGMGNVLKYIVTGVVSVLTVVAFFIAAIIFDLLINRIM